MKSLDWNHIRAFHATAATGSLSAAARQLGLTQPLSRQVQEISGRVCISATDSMSAYILPGIVERIRAEAPRIAIVITAANELGNLHRREADNRGFEGYTAAALWPARRHCAPSGFSGVGSGRTGDWDAHHGLRRLPVDMVDGTLDPQAGPAQLA
ncbi:LysR family transcriptional regulator [Paracoccus alkanivorans]|uniref:LysR family transcriptional regulator n=1 Tax=Paracoccus alkanivorans TaxID=2116655 RepID=UPI003C7E940D